ncbi:MAG TPA: arginine--tRNA ligase [candidate division Zixibacteria bacterium]|nr:arginine--tRNA ligase [candidate division Zixibacteria bacterium]
MPSIREQLRAALTEARQRAVAAGDLPIPDGTELPPVHVERPARPEHGDYATNAAMQLAPVVRRAPMQVAETLRTHLGTPEGIAEASVAPPGFLNLRLEPSWVAAQTAAILEAGTDFGAVRVAEPRNINVEFVSANPTGPLHVGNARGAFVGDLLCRVLEGVGHRVTREYYFNDYNAQVRNLGLSVWARRRNEPVPEDGYHGDYVAELANQVPDDVWERASAPGADPGDVLGRWASERIRAGIEASLAALGVRFDVWTTEASLHDEGWVARAVDQLRSDGHVYERDGATWFRASAFGDDKDRVVYRSNGAPTYFASDIGYLANKFSRGFTELIYLWGEDHHGTVARNRAAATALGFDASRVHWLLMAWVRFVREGREIGMSKRAGEYVTLDELLAEVGADAARWFFGSRAHTTGIDFDIELAKRQSAENPVYYVQYAHARCCSILRNAAERSIRPDASRADDLLHHPAEQTLLRRMLELPDVVADSAERLETHEITRFLLETAQLFSQFYRDCRVLSGDPAEADLSAARLALTDATRQVLANGLSLLGISAPESM